MMNIPSFFRRNNLSIGIVIIAAVLGSILFLQALATSRLQEQVATQKQLIIQVRGITDQINKNGAQRTAQIDDINRHMDCIVQFFAEPNRAIKSITDIESCRVEQVSVRTLPSITPRPTIPTSATSSNSTNNGEVAVATPQIGTAISATPTPTPLVSPVITPTPQPSLVDRILDPIRDLFNRL